MAFFFHSFRHEIIAIPPLIYALLSIFIRLPLDKNVVEWILYLAVQLYECARARVYFQVWPSENDENILGTQTEYIQWNAYTHSLAKQITKETSWIRRVERQILILQK